MRKVILAAAVSILCGQAMSQTSDQDNYTIKGDAHTGSNIRHDEIYSWNIPLDKPYSQLSDEQKKILKSQYVEMGPTDEPPYPMYSPKSVFEAILKGADKFRDTGDLSFLVDVSSSGAATKISVLKTTSQEMTEFASNVLYLTKFKPALCKGEPCAQQYLFRMKINDGLMKPEPPSKKSTDFQDLLNKAEKGDVAAQTFAGKLYQSGASGKVDSEAAVMWYKRAADQNYAPAQYLLGLAYQDGLGVAKDNAVAMTLFKASAEQGNADAQNELGWKYLNGLGVDKDEAVALKWFQLAVNQNQVRAQTSLGMMYAKGIIVKQDYDEATRLYRLAANQGFAQAQSNLAWMYYNGHGAPQDDRGAVKWMTLAAKQERKTQMAKTILVGCCRIEKQTRPI